MALRLSTGLVDGMLGNAYLMGTSLTYHDGGGGNDYITDSENRFLISGFKVGDTITTTGSTTAGNDMVDETILAVAAGKLEVATGTVVTPEDFVAATDCESNNQGSFQQQFNDCIMDLYSGSQPASADESETGTKLLRVTLSSGDFVPGAALNGLSFRAPLNGIIGKKAGEVWSGVGIAEGTAGWFRLYGNAVHTGAVVSAVRLDGNCGVSGAQLNLSSTAIKVGATTTIDTFEMTQPMSA